MGDLDRLSQRNASTGKERRIRRSLSSKSTRAETPTRLGSAPSEASFGFFRADTADTIPSSWNDAEYNAKAAHLGLGSSKRSLSTVSSIPGLPGMRARQGGIAAPASLA